MIIVNGKYFILINTHTHILVYFVESTVLGDCQ